MIVPRRTRTDANEETRPGEQLSSSVRVVGNGETDVIVTLSDASDAALVVGIGRYSKESLAEAFRRHGGPAFRLAERLLRDEQRAQDVVQEVFLLLWTHPERFDPDRGSLRSWVLMKSHGRAVDLVRAESTRRRREEQDLVETAMHSYDLEREVVDLVEAERVQHAVEALPQSERSAITLAYFGGHSYRDVAVMLGEPEGTVKSRIRSGLKTMRLHLRDLGSPGGGTGVSSSGARNDILGVES